MAQIVPLNHLDSYPNELLAQLLDGAPQVSKLKEGVEVVMRAIHGLPEIMDCELSQVEVYLGRAAAEPARLRQRWGERLFWFEGWRSTVAMVAFRTRTSLIRTEKWELTAQRFVRFLQQRGVLCCANAHMGGAGRWPDTRETAIYLVARKRRGRPTDEPTDDERKLAVGDLIDQKSFEDTAAMHEAARLILHPEEMTEHEWCPTNTLLHRNGNSELSEAIPACKVCHHPARPGNYGFCGYHRR
ncbi:MAG: hypothetical protein NNA18_11215 [Nitrospira sp.]|nr:hypothetical protein [Nitrospira sp.]